MLSKSYRMLRNLHDCCYRTCTKVGHCVQRLHQRPGSIQSNFKELSPFIEVMGTNGKVIRECHASQTCIDQKVSYERRCLLIRNLKNVHKITNIHVPEHQTGRPKTSERPPRPVSPRSKRQCVTRFGDIAYKVRAERRKFHKALQVRATKEWERVFDKEEKSQIEWEEAWIEAQKSAWEGDMPSRITKLEAKIKRGYKPRAYGVPHDADIPREENERDDKEGIKVSDDESAIPVSSSTTSFAHVETISFLVSHDHLVCEIDHSNMDQFLDRCRKGVTFVLRSSRSGLESGLDAHVIDDVLDLEASTKTINLFALWMESILPPDVLSGAHIFTFFPVLDRSHWVLVEFYNAHLIRIPTLSRRRSSILLFDSLSIVCMERLLPHVPRVLKHFSKHCSNLQVKEELEDPREACELLTAQCP
ncbi:hypothetical protein GOP47_0020686 [Adiantum capillus-veneris]|uniref:Ubiquitin-like protease family profile domain-containing protein n=1 Tax=Adiantum capillus-veneris TaxID=13818 RepID=A0A9D4Z8X6_ADICA|nr:hypothetical protein GOP47_0020686 [Adiantum capillus-veneris]